jgi:hypothetical protein
MRTTEGKHAERQIKPKENQMKLKNNLISAVRTRAGNQIKYYVEKKRSHPRSHKEKRNTSEYCPEREIVSNLRLERVSHSNKKNQSGPRAKTHHIQVDLLAMFLAVAICAITFIHLARS